MADKQVAELSMDALREVIRQEIAAYLSAQSQAGDERSTRQIQ